MTNSFILLQVSAEVQFLKVQVQVSVPVTHTTKLTTCAAERQHVVPHTTWLVFANQAPTWIWSWEYKVHRKAPEIILGCSNFVLCSRS